MLDGPLGVDEISLACVMELTDPHNGDERRSRAAKETLVRTSDSPGTAEYLAARPMSPRHFEASPRSLLRNAPDD